MNLSRYLGISFILLLSAGIFISNGASAAPAAANPACALSYAQLSLVKESHPVLRQVTAAIDPNTIQQPQIQQLISSLKTLMKKSGGIGIAAPQAGESLSLAIADTSKFGKLTLINPKVTPLDGALTTSLEGCLSLPGRCGFVTRNRRVKVDFLDEHAVPRSIEAKGMDAVVIQHEVDHLNGVLYTDRNGRNARKIGKLPRTALWRLDSDGKMLVSRFVAGLEPQELAYFKSSLRKPLSSDIRALAQRHSSAASLLELDEVSSKNNALREILAAYKIIASKGSAAQKAERLGTWAKSDLHALYLADALEKIGDKESWEILASLKADNAHFDFIGLPGIRGPPVKDTSSFFVIAGTDAPVKGLSVQDSIDLARLSRKFHIQSEGKGFSLQFKQGDTLTKIKVSDPATALKFARISESSGAEEALARPIRTHGPRFLNGNPAAKITFGLESEVDFRESPELLQSYRVQSVTDTEWKNLTREEQLAQVDAVLAAATKKNTMPFVKVSDAPSWMPEKIDAELDGHAELNGLIFNTIEETRAFVKNFTEKYGPGYWQGHVVFPKSADLAGLVGYTLLEGDFAQLKSLESGYFKYLSDDSFLPGRFLTHHSLGPLSEEQKTQYLAMEEKTRNGKAIGSAGPGRVFNGPALRDDKYPKGYVGYELRQFHKRGDQLVDAMDDLSLQLQLEGNMKKLEPASRVELVSERLSKQLPSYGVDDQAKHQAWNELFSDMEEGVRGKYPGVLIGAAPISQRFLLPFRPWLDHPALSAAAAGLSQEEKASLRERLQAASRSYAETVLNIASAYQSGALPLQAAEDQAQLAMAKWAYEAQLSPVLKKYEDSLLIGKKSTFGDFLQRTGNIKSVETYSSEPQHVTVTGLKREEREFKNGRKYDLYESSAASFARAPNIEEFKKNTVEVMFEPAAPYGHIRLRVGTNIYTFNFSKDAKAAPFDYRKSASTNGYAFFVSPDKITSLEAEIKRIYQNSQSHNLPPFDPNSAPMQIRGPPGSLRYKRKIHSIFSLLSSNSLDAKLVEENGKTQVVTPYNFRYPAEKKDGIVCIQSLSCATSATYVLKEFFGIDLGFLYGAKSLRDALASGNLPGRVPDAVINYR